MRVWLQIASDYGADASLTSLLDTMDIYMLIVANPDGYVYTHASVRHLPPLSFLWTQSSDVTEAVCRRTVCGGRLAP